MTVKNVIDISVKAALIILSAPLVSGFIRKIKNRIRMRIGQGVFQPYYNIKKLFSKDEVVSTNASWIFYATPAIVFAGTICALSLVLAAQSPCCAERRAAVLIAAFFVLALARFFLALAGLDTGSSFGGMGSSREMFISSFAEPVVFVAVFVLCAGPTNVFKASNLLAVLAMFFVTLAETSRLPVDNQETHLELTMVHEAMALEYSGPSLGLIEISGHVKQMIFFVLLSTCLFPASSALPAWVSFPVKIAFIGTAVAIVEVSIAKMRLFRVVDFLGFSFFMAFLAAVLAAMGF